MHKNKTEIFEKEIERLHKSLFRFERALNSINDVIIWCNNKREVEWCNDALGQLINKNKVFIIGKDIDTILQLSSNSCNNFNFEYILSSYLKDKSSDIYECSFNSEIYFNLKINEFSYNNTYAFYITLENINAQKMAKMLSENKSGMEIFGILAANTLHEISTPLQTILNNMDFINSKISSSMTYKDIGLEDANNIYDENNICADQLFYLIKNFRQNIAKFTNKNTHNKQHSNQSNLKDITDNVIKIFRKKYPHIKFLIKNSVENTKLVIDIGPNKLYQIFFNIINNSIDAINSKNFKNEQPIVIIYIDHCNKYKLTNIKIEDNGIGIENNEIKNLFNIFYSTKKDGTGLGLAIVRKIIEEQLNGEINIESLPNKGTSLNIKLKGKLQGNQIRDSLYV